MIWNIDKQPSFFDSDNLLKMILKRSKYCLIFFYSSMTRPANIFGDAF